MQTIDWLERVLEASVERKGEVPLTNAHLLNCIKLAKRIESKHEQRTEAMLNEVLAEDRKWGA
jgi:hypothetical protein